MQTNQDDSPFLRLPAELRNKIYDHVLGGKIIRVTGLEQKKDNCTGAIYPYDPSTYAKDRDPIAIENYKPRDRYTGEVTGSNHPSNTCALLCMCRQTYTDAHLLPYSLNTFSLTVWPRSKYGAGQCG
jgi:hypothetical protein